MCARIDDCILMQCNTDMKPKSELIIQCHLIIKMNIQVIKSNTRTGVEKTMSLELKVIK